MLPDYLIIGAARCGTSWLAKNLSIHPQIYLPRKKELHFFDRDYQLGIDFYERYFNNRKEEIVGEATPAYLYFPEIPERIYKHMPDVKLIATLRNPVDRAFSHYLNLKSKAKEGNINSTISFEDKLKMTPRLIREGFYYNMLKRYYNLFNKEQIKVLIFEEMMKEPTIYLKRIYEFLGVDSVYFSPLINQKINASSTKLGKHSSLYFIYKIVMRLHCYQLVKIIDMINRSDAQKMKNSTYHYLKDIYKEKNKMLESLIGESLACWD